MENGRGRVTPRTQDRVSGGSLLRLGQSSPSGTRYHTPCSHGGSQAWGRSPSGNNVDLASLLRQVGGISGSWRHQGKCTVYPEEEERLEPATAHSAA